MDKKDSIKKHVPGFFKPNSNRIWKTLLEAEATEQNKVVEQIKESKKQIFVSDAEGRYLDKLGNNVKVFRPKENNLTDAKYRLLIPLLSYHPKQLVTLIIKILDIFYGERFSRFNVTANNNPTYDFSSGGSLVYKTEKSEVNTLTKSLLVDGETDGANTIRISSTEGIYVGQVVFLTDDNGLIRKAEVQSLTASIVTLDISTALYTVANNAVLYFDTYDYLNFEASDFEDPANATGLEVVAAINSKGNNISAQTLTLDTEVNVRTNTFGQKGLIQILGGTANSILDFPLVKGQSLEVEANQIKPNEIVVKIPSSIPAQFRELIGSHHFHEDETIVSDWPGSFLYGGKEFGNYSLRDVETTLQQNVVKGQVYTQISVADSSAFPDEEGYLMFNFGIESKMEYPIKYLKRPTNTLLTLDPSYQFQKSHSIGENISLIVLGATVPNKDGSDYGLFLVGSDDAREEIINIIESIIAEGVKIRWDIRFPVCGKGLV